MRSAHLSFAVAFTLSASLPALAVGGFFSGTTAIAFCGASTGPELNFCGGYVAGAVDAMEQSGKSFCFPTGVEVVQLRLVYTRYLQNNPAKLHLPAAELFSFSMAEAFPCE